jgi:predicted MPP superfamily phosphohydrolase
VGYLNFAFVAAIASWLAWGVARVAGASLDMGQVAGGLFAVAGLATVYGLVNAATLRVTRFVVELPNLPAAWRDRDVALVSDLHVGNIRGPRFIRRVVARLNELKPDAVFIAGDMFDGAQVNIPEAVKPWATFRAPKGTYFVTGNHDEFSDSRAYIAALAPTGVRVLNNEALSIEGLQIIGVHDSETHRPDHYREILRRVRIDPARASILLVHQPAHLRIPEEAGISLQLSGHTHRGQFWPWSILVRRIYGPFAYGLNRLGRMQVCTSSGAGSWGPPMRVGSKSEIVLLTLRAAK